MTLKAAKHAFAHLMKVARTRPLTVQERKGLQRAGQVIRYQKRAGRNPKQIIEAEHADVFVHNRKKKLTRAKARLILSEGKVHGRRLTAKQRGFFGARASGAPRLNPAGWIRMGRLVELRYERDHGRSPGFYKHVFKTLPTLYYNPKNNTIIVKGK